MKVNEAIEILKQELLKIPHLRQLAPGNQEFELWRDKILNVIDAALDAGDRTRFSRAVPMRLDWSWVSTNGLTQARAQAEYVKNLNSYETALKSIIEKYEMILGETVSTSKVLREAVYSNGTPYDAYKDIKNIIILAANKLIIVDPYVDGSVLSLLENAKPSVAIQVLARKMQGDFRLASKKFKQQREMAGHGSFEVRRDKKSFHDRFIVSDDKFFHLGVSIKDAGIKVFAINEIENSRNKSVLGKNIRNAWDAAEKVL